MTTKRTARTGRKPAAPKDEVVTPDEVEFPEGVDAEIVQMFHPETPGSDLAETTRAAYREMWAAKGWRIVSKVERDAEGVLQYTLEPKLDPSEVPEEVDLVGDGVVAVETVETTDTSRTAASDAGSSG